VWKYSLGFSEGACGGPWEGKALLAIVVAMLSKLQGRYFREIESQDTTILFPFQFLLCCCFLLAQVAFHLCPIIRRCGQNRKRRMLGIVNKSRGALCQSGLIRSLATLPPRPPLPPYNEETARTKVGIQHVQSDVGVPGHGCFR